MKIQSRREEISKRRYERNIIAILLGIVILLIAFFFYGAPLLINFILLVGNMRGGNETVNNTKESSLLVPPILNPIQDATNSARISISGTAAPGQTVKLYLNGKYINKTTVNDKNNFVFDNVLLDENDNDIKTTAINDDNKESDYSQDLKIVYKNKLPNLDINYPQDKLTISGSNQIKVEGKSDSGVRVTVNGYWAIVDNNGNFSYLLNLKKGENKINVTASDEAGNQTAKEITVTLNQ